MGKETDQANVKPDDATGNGPAGSSDDDDEDDEDDEDEGEQAPTIESLQADLKKMATALKRANTEAKNNRLALKELKEGKKPEGDGKKDADQGESAKLAREIKVRDAAEALMEAGFNGTVKAARKAVRSFDELDGTGLLDEVEAFKEEFPGMFKRKRRVESPAGGTKGDRRNPDAENGGGGALSEATRKMLGLTRR